MGVCAGQHMPRIEPLHDGRREGSAFRMRTGSLSHWRTARYRRCSPTLHSGNVGAGKSCTMGKKTTDTTKAAALTC